LAGLLGLLLGAEVAPALLIALVAGVLAGVVVLARQAPGERRRTGVPFGPFLALGGLTAIYAGHAILSAYLNHLA
jgi:leader peptidase (prepilin peptidase) / N-methyltransferase